VQSGLGNGLQFPTQFPSFGRGRVPDPNSGGEQNANKGGAERREHVGDIDHPSCIDARKPSRFHIRANREDIATEPAVMKKNISRDRYDDYHPEKIRKDEKTSSREAGEIIGGNGNRGAVGHEKADTTGAVRVVSAIMKGGRPSFLIPKA
jgi:hypothetical protein